LSLALCRAAPSWPVGKLARDHDNVGHAAFAKALRFAVLGMRAHRLLGVLGYLRLLFSDRMLEQQARCLDQWRGQRLG